MKTIKNYLYNLTFKLLTIILPIITTPYISRVLRVNGVGKYSVSYAIVNYFVLFGMLGFSTYGNREIAYVRDDDNERIQTFWEINNLKFITMGISTIVYLMYVIFILPKELFTLYFAQFFVLIASLFDISWYFSGVENFRKIALRNISIKLFSILLIFTFVKEQSDLPLYALIISSSAFVGQIVLWKDIDLKNLFYWRKNRKGKTYYHLRRTMGLWLPALAITVFTQFDKIMLGYICGDFQVGLYDSSDKILRMLAMIVTSFSTIMVPKMANLFSNKNLNTFKILIDKSLSAVQFMSIPLTFGIIGISQTLVPWFFGIGYEDTSRLLLVSAWLAITLGLSSVFGNQVLISLNRENEFTIAVLVAAIVNILMNIILIPKLEAMGAIIATVISQYVNMIIMMYYVREYFNHKKFIINFIRYGFSALIMCVLVYFLGEALKANVITTLVQIIVGCIVYFGILLLFKDEILLNILDICRRNKRHSNII